MGGIEGMHLILAPGLTLNPFTFSRPITQRETILLHTLIAFTLTQDLFTLPFWPTASEHGGRRFDDECGMLRATIVFVCCSKWITQPHRELLKEVDRMTTRTMHAATVTPFLKDCNLRKAKSLLDRSALHSGGLQLTNGQTVPHQRLLGAYYTPDAVAEALVRWALNGSPGHLLDPSFGGCAFLEAGAKVMEELGCRNAGDMVFGNDIEAECISYVRNSSLLLERNCTFEDFLALSPSDLPGAPFQAIVGNPPYVRHHWVKDEKRVVARRIADESSAKLANTASLWAYFVVHALAFIAKGGRLAMLVPEAILQADYADAVRNALESSFRRVRLVHIRERLFEGTDEPVVVIAGEGFGESGTLSVDSLDTAAELETLLRGVKVAHPYTTLANGRRATPAALKAAELVRSSGQTIRFDSLATARIGVVTGANSYFIRAADELKKLGIPAKARTGIVARTNWLSGLEFTDQDHKHFAASGSRVFLIRPPCALEGLPGVKRWVTEGETAGVHERHKCAKRDPWFRVDLSSRPDAFVTSTRLGPPLLVLNRTNYRCTNALYAVRLNLLDGVPPECIVIGFLTTFVALWAELNGRRYGGGALKVDLRTLSKLPIPVVPRSSSIFVAVNDALREGNEDHARNLADRAVLQDGLGLSKHAIKIMRCAHQDLVRQRIPDARGS